MSHLQVPPLEGAPPRHGVLYAHGEYRVIALAPFEAGERIFQLEGIEVSRPSRYTVQLGANRHLDVPPGTSEREAMERYPWRYLNHSCAPNAAVRGRELVALRPIGRLEEITFDYASSEWSLAEPFPCRCGACDGALVRGFAFLSLPERERRRERLAPHLLAHLEGR